MRLFLILTITLVFSGCAYCGGQIKTKNAEISGMMDEIRDLKAQLAQKEEDIKAKDATINDLKARLRNFGVF